MDLKNLIKWSAILAALLVFKKLNADEIPEGSLQNHHAYMLLLKEATDTASSEQSGLLTAISEHMAFSEERSQIFLDYLVTSRHTLDENNQSVTEKLLCNNPHNGHDDEVYAMLDTLQDIRDDNLRKHYRHAMASVGLESGARLDTWLQTYSQEASNIRVIHDHKALYESMGMKADTVIGASCNQIAASFRTRTPVNY